MRAALTQFDYEGVTVVRYGGIRTREQVRQVIGEAATVDGLVVHTLVSEDLRHSMLNEGRALNVATIDLMGALLLHMAELFKVQPRSQPGLFRPFGSSYMERIEAIEFSVRHDDGRNIDDIDRAEVTLVGVSRTSKTPLSVYLAYRGWKVANVPLALGVEPPEQIFRLPRKRAVGLIIRPERLVDLRLERVERMGTSSRGYADMEHVRREVAYAYEVFSRRPDWPLIDVTNKPIEETADEVVAVLGRRARLSEGEW